jgi:hypothetical protein
MSRSSGRGASAASARSPRDRTASACRRKPPRRAGLRRGR